MLFEAKAFLFIQEVKPDQSFKYINRSDELFSVTEIVIQSNRLFKCHIQKMIYFLQRIEICVPIGSYLAMLDTVSDSESYMSSPSQDA